MTWQFALACYVACGAIFTAWLLPDVVRGNAEQARKEWPALLIAMMLYSALWLPVLIWDVVSEDE